ncbi:LD-carboxypeptidase [Bordetella sp. N]|uniref:S66 peptidase family protein n=1 Tax=Bordetella sp. N TaxID=1746199 RepID=UPI0007093D57|nr:LD-carboxypeptidase [Bordetella sp. N]ALM84382.1 LD-carboxypeptidase [Bordetella sp. N]
MPAYRAGSTVAIVAPASAAADAADDAAMWLQARNIPVRVMPAARTRMPAPFDYLAGTDAARVQDLHDAFAAPDVGAVWCLQGGFGSWRLLDALDYDLLRRNAKPFIGYSDITALHLAIQRHAGFVTFHGPMLGQDFLAGREPPTEAAVWRMISGGTQPGDPVAPPPAPMLTPLLPGRASGRLVGGNLSLVAALIGTPHEIDTRDAILFIEDVNEAPPRIDRMLSQLREAGKFKGLRGVLAGDFTRSGATDTDELEQLAIATLLQVYFQDLNIPVITGWPSGHGDPNLTLPLGAHVTLDPLRGLIQEQAVVI